MPKQFDFYKSFPICRFLKVFVRLFYQKKNWFSAKPYFSFCNMFFGFFTRPKKLKSCKGKVVKRVTNLIKMMMMMLDRVDTCWSFISNMLRICCGIWYFLGL